MSFIRISIGSKSKKDRKLLDEQMKRDHERLIKLHNMLQTDPLGFIEQEYRGALFGLVQMFDPVSLESYVDEIVDVSPFEDIKKTLKKQLNSKSRKVSK